MATGSLERLNNLIDGLIQLLGMQYYSTIKEIVRQDQEIRWLKKGRDFRRVITPDPDKVEDSNSP